MKNRLSKSMERLKKEKKVSFSDNSKRHNLSSFNVKVFRNLSEKYNLSLTLNENNIIQDNKEENLSLGAQITLDRIKKGDVFSP